MFVMNASGASGVTKLSWHGAHKASTPSDHSRQASLAGFPILHRTGRLLSTTQQASEGVFAALRLGCLYHARKYRQRQFPQRQSYGGKDL